MNLSIGLTLASTSPRRKFLLERFFPGMVVESPSAHEEKPHEGMSLEETVEWVKKIALSKARSIRSENVIISADTILLFENKVLGKPRDREDAKEILLSLSGRDHYVVTGVAVRLGSNEISRAVHSRVEFVNINSDMLEEYLDTGEYLDKAGGYGIQGFGGDFVSRFEGSWSNIVGLPLGVTRDLLEEFGLKMDISSGQVILVAGMPGSGKEEFVRAARTRMYAVVRMGDIVRETAASSGADMGDMGVGGFASAQRQQMGEDIWARQTLDRLATLDAFNVVVDGTRSHHEVGYFRRALGKRLHLVAVESSGEIRYKRLVNRGRSDAPESFEAFMEREKRESGWGIVKAIEMADFKISNETTLEDLRHRVVEFLKSLEN